MSSSLPLKNKTILVTRPEDTAGSLLMRIKQAGGTALHYPVIRIGDIDESESLTSIINHISSFDIAIFISPTAVIKTLDKIKALPKNLTLAVIGHSTKAMLEKFGYLAQIIPDDFNTESLLLHPALQQAQIVNKSIVIFRGIGGRELLGDTLAQRGSKVTYAETYQREINPLSSLTADQLTTIDAVTISSNEGLQNLYDLTNNACKPLLTALPLIVPSTRAYDLASDLGFKTIIKASNATNDACIQALSDKFSTTPSD